MKYSLLMPFVLNLEVSEFKQSYQKEIMSGITHYLLGCIKYGDAYSLMREFGVHMIFSKTLRTLSPKSVRYSRTAFRRLARKEDVEIHPFDEHWLRQIKISRNTKIHVRRYPSECEVVKSMTPTAKARAFKALGGGAPAMRDNAVTNDDVAQDLLLKVVDAYRLYIHGYASVLDPMAFYSCLHQSLSTRAIDFQKSIGCKKGQIDTVSLDGFTFDDRPMEEVIKLDENMFQPALYSCTPEAIYEAKEVFDSLSNLERAEMLAIYRS